MANLLFELGVEELPSGCLDVVYDELPGRARKSFEENRISSGTLTVEATPRRIVLFVHEVALKQTDQTFELTGPSVEKAYDGAGNPTPALEGFLRGKNAAMKEVQVKETPRGKCVFVRKTEKGKAIKSVLPGLLSQIILSLPFPRAMRWESSGFRFPRPIRWMVALLDAQILPVQLAGIRAGNQTAGHRFLSPKVFKIPRADWRLYTRLLKKNHVMIERAERQERIRRDLARRFKQASPDPDLVHLTSQLVEEPFLLEGTFSKSHLVLPPEVLATCMKKHQKVFACKDAQGRLTGRFVAVSNGARRGLPKIQADFENVLESRLKDARYFYDQDVQAPLESKRPLLDQIVYLGKLGTLLDKTKRLESLAEIQVQKTGQSSLSAELKRTAALAKIDLMTHLVYEFPELQGLAGREYARASGEQESVARAIGEQYLPKNLSEDFKNVQKQMSVLGALYGILDRMDLLVGAFGTGLEPSGSQDPYALRRAGGLVVKLVRAFGFEFPLKDLIGAHAAQYSGRLKPDAEKTLGSTLGKFFKDRMAFELGLEASSREHEIFEAIWKSPWSSLADVFSRFEILTRVYEQERDVFLKTAKVMERTGNISRSVAGHSEIQESLLTDPLERDLASVYREKAPLIEQTFQRRDYAAATRLYGDAFFGPIDAFFKQVMVNVEDSAIRANRQALLKCVFDLYAGRLADLSGLSRIGQE